MYRVTLGVLGVVGLAGTGSSALEASSRSVTHQSATGPIPTLGGDPPRIVVGAGGRGQPPRPRPGSNGESMVEKVGQMVDESNEGGHTQDQGTNLDDISPEERKAQEEMPRNTKKRMYEAEADWEKEKQRQAGAYKDEL
jgi:hypothetical protein